ILHEGLGADLKYPYIPGNPAETGGESGNPQPGIGPTHTSPDHQGTRATTLDTSRLSLRGGRPDQVGCARPHPGQPARRRASGPAFSGGHGGAGHAARVDAVPYVINGNSAKDPAAPPGDGGFAGWSLWGVDPVTAKEAEHVRRNGFADAPDWIGAQLRPHVDE